MVLRLNILGSSNHFWILAEGKTAFSRDRKTNVRRVLSYFIFFFFEAAADSLFSHRFRFLLGVNKKSESSHSHIFFAVFQSTYDDGMVFLAQFRWKDFQQGNVR